MKKGMKLCIMFLLICVLTAGCSSKLTESGQSDGQADKGEVQSARSYEGVAGNQAYGDDLSSDPSADDNAQSSVKKQEESDGKEQTEATQEVKKETKEEKLVYTCNLTIETTTYDSTMEEIEKQIKAYSGIIESQNEYDHDSGWYRDDHKKTSGTMECSIVVKIPSRDYQAFLKSLDGTGKMTNKSMDVTNISRTYYDTQATIESLQIQEKRLLKMMDEAKTIDDMITVENRLTEVQTELNQYKTRLSTMDTEVAYSTITMTIKEVLEYKQSVEGRRTNTFKERLVNTLQDSWSSFLSFMEGLLFLLIWILPFAVVFLILWLITKPLRRKLKKRRQEKNMKKRETRYMTPRKDSASKKGRFSVSKNTYPEDLSEKEEVFKDKNTHKEMNAPGGEDIYKKENTPEKEGDFERENAPGGEDADKKGK